MIPTIERRFTDLERRKQAVLARAASWPQTHCASCPAPGHWSLLDILDHLHKTESGILARVRATLPSGQPVQLSHRLRGWMLTQLFRSPARVKVPQSANSVLPGPNLDLPTLTQNWSATRLQWRDFLEQVTPRSLSSGVFRHPVSGWMNLPRTLHFLSSHITHHGYQLNRIESALRQSPIANLTPKPDAPSPTKTGHS